MLAYTYWPTAQGAVAKPKTSIIVVLFQEAGAYGNQPSLPHLKTPMVAVGCFIILGWRQEITLESGIMCIHWSIDSAKHQLAM